MALLAPGAVIAGYRIESVVGRGGMGVVYRAREVALDRVVALKLIAPELLEDAAIRERFVQEARTAAAIEHPNVIPVHAAGEVDGVAYLAMRFVVGADLRTRGRERPLTAEVAADLITRLGDALDAIHRAGYVHRDVKPANVLVAADGHVYLTDFGLAKQTLTHGGATATGQWVGTLDYIAPEQIRGAPVDARTDVYALGGVLYFALTGAVPFAHENDEAKLWAQLNEPPPVPSARRPELPRALDDVVARAMAKEPGDRFLSAGDLARATRAAVSGEAPTRPERTVARGAAAPAVFDETPTVTAAGPPHRRRRVPLVAAGILAAAAAAAAIALVASWDGPTKPSTAATGTTTATAIATATATATAATTVASTTRPSGMRTVRVGRRPNGVVLAGGKAWVTSAFVSTVRRFEAKTMKALPSVKVGRGALSIAPDGTGVWIVLKGSNEVVRVNSAGKIKLHLRPSGASPTRVAVGLGSVWVAASWIDGTNLLIRYARDGRELARLPIAHGILGLAVGHGHVWIASTTRPEVLRVDPRAAGAKLWATMPGGNSGLYYGGGALWATLTDLDSIARVDPRRRNSVLTTAIGHSPERTVAARGRIYVTVDLDHKVAILDPKHVKSVAPALNVPSNPFAITADARALWVTGLGSGTLARIPFS